MRLSGLVAIVLTVVLVLAAVAMYFINPFHTTTGDPFARVLGFATYRIPSSAMEPTIHAGEIIVVKTWPLASRDPKVGEIIVFCWPPDPRIKYIKRVVATGGMTVEMKDGGVRLDGRALAEPYLAATSMLPNQYGDSGPMQVPAGHFFVLGDNRDNSADSRMWGFVPRELVIGVYTPEQ